MSIATQITRLNNNIEAMKTTKQQIKDAMNNDFDIIANEQIEDYAELIEDGLELYKDCIPSVETNQATEITVDDAMKYSRNKLQLFGNTEQVSYQGYNLVDVSPYQEETKNGVTLTKDSDGNIILNGTSTSAFGWNVSLPETRVLPAGTYTKSITKDSNIGTYLTVSIGYNGSAITTTSIQPSRGTNTMAFEQDTNYDQVRMYITNNTTFNNYKLSYMILSGEYTAQTIPNYEPYVGGVPSPNPDYPQPIHVVTGENTVEVQGKNLFNIGNATVSSRGINWIPQNDGSVIIQGTATGTSTYGFTSEKIIPAGQYTFSIKNPMSQKLKLRCKKISNSTYWYFSIPIGNTSAIVNLPEDMSSIQLYIDTELSVGDELNYTIYPQLEQGSTVTAYEPYYHQEYPINLGSLELCKIGTVQDYIYKENDNWYKYNAVIKVVLNGTESWNYSSGVHITTKLEDYAISDNIPFSTKYVGIINGGSSRLANYQLAFNNSTAQNRLYIKDDRYTTSADFKTYLQGNNVPLYYGLREPTSTQITDTTLIAQLDAIYEHLQLIKGTNHITVTASDLKPYMKLSYKNYESNLTNE